MTTQRTHRIIIRPEVFDDFKNIDKLVTTAFQHAEHSDGTEAFLVQRLRSSASYIPELALVAETDHQLIGHILFSKIYIQSPTGCQHLSLALAPVSVAPEFQKQGVGSSLIQTGHNIATQLGYESVIVLGHPSYYPRFGYRPTHLWDISPPFKVPDEVFMAVELTKNSLKHVQGSVVYPPEFGLSSS